MPNDLPDWFKIGPVPLGSLIVPSGQTLNSTFTLQPGMSACTVLVAGGAVAASTSSILGQTTGVDYSQVPVGPNGGQKSIYTRPKQLYAIAIDTVTDTQVKFTFSPVSSTLTVYVSLWPTLPAGWKLDNQVAPISEHVGENESTPQLPDWQGSNKVNGAGTASLTFAGVAGRIAQLSEARFRAIAGASRVFSARVWDGASGGSLIAEQWIGDGSASVGTQPDEAVFHNLKTIVNTFMTFDFDAACNAGERQSIYASGWNK